MKQRGSQCRPLKKKKNNKKKKKKKKGKTNRSGHCQPLQFFQRTNQRIRNECATPCHAADKHTIRQSVHRRMYGPPAHTPKPTDRSIQPHHDTQHTTHTHTQMDPPHLSLNQNNPGGYRSPSVYLLAPPLTHRASSSCLSVATSLLCKVAFLAAAHASAVLTTCCCLSLKWRLMTSANSGGGDLSRSTMAYLTVPSRMRRL
mmetsp:Transcript_8668/g.24784  ORF Transcript_8668/g.24784 Transcript_8668/m.24784 type:complete len:201 (+) Transcript_8668:576-1178(+)